jgi:hypothetical protein
MVDAIGCVVEGYGELAAIPVLLRRIAQEISGGYSIRIPKPVRRPRASLVNRKDELERAVELARRSAGATGGVLVLIDTDDDCPAELGPRLLARARSRLPVNVPVGVVLATREFEGWFLAAASSLAGRSGLPANLEPPVNPDAIRDAKGWLSQRMQGNSSYVPTLHQAAFASLMDIQQARSSDSFDKLFREMQKLLADAPL